MAEPAISISGLGKRYRLQRQASERYTALRDVIQQGFKNLVTRKSATDGSREETDFWALRDVSFDVSQGESVGIVGRNGAGKSTLLKILSRITEPTAGRFSWRGRMASLLEVGTGFHPELTGRENIYLNAAILGMNRAEIRARLDQIVAFAEVERFLDTPVKRYSSGMYMRLAFAVAAHVEPDILVLDEVLAVGDIAFQRKCFSRLGDLATQQKTTVLMISHNMQALLRLCDRGLLLHDGRLVAEGGIDSVVQQYHRQFAENRLSFDCTQQPRADRLRLQATIRRVAIEGSDAGVSFGSALEFRLEIEQRVATPGLALAWAVFSSHGDETASARVMVASLPAPRSAICLRIPHLRLAPGHYTVNFGLHSDLGDEDFVSQGLMFDVLPNDLSAAAWTDTIHAPVVPETEITGIEPA